MALIDTLRQRYPDYSDDEILGALKATKYPDYSIDEIGKAVGYNPSDLGRGFKESFQQLPQLGYGALAGIGAAGETMLGEGGIMSGLKRAGVQGFQDWGDKIASGARESDSFSYSYDQAKEGNFGALVDWLQHGLGYVGGQGLQALASAGIGAVGGKMALGASAQQIAKGMVLKEAAVIGATAEGKALAKDALIAQATQNVASKLGQTAAVGALAVGQEGGEIFGDLASQSVKEGRTLTGDELAKAFGATLAAGGLEFVGDKLGLDIIMGKSRIGNKLMGMAGEAPGLGGKLARGAMAGAAAVPAEAGTEYFQTGIEEFGKGTEASPLPWQQSPENQAQAFDAAALGALGGGAIGAGGGLMSRAAQRADPVEATRRLAEARTVDEMVKAANDIAMAPLTPAVRPRQANESTINEIRSLGDPALEQEALGLAATAASRSAAPGVRRYAQNRLDEILLPVRQVPVGEATEMLPTGEATEVQSPAEAEAAAQANIAQWLARSKPMDEARANALVEQAQARGMDMTVIPHGAEGFTVVPSGWLAPRQRIPVGEAADMIPAGDATEITPENIELGQIPVGEATEVGGPRPEGMAERTGARNGQVLDLSGRTAVSQYIARQRQTNTPAARAFVQEFEAGRITPADVMDLIAPGQRAEPTPDQRLAAAAAQAPKIQPGDLLTADGQPYGTRAGAAVRAKREGGGAVVEVPGGYVVRKESPGEPVADLASPAAVPAAPADGLGDQPGRSLRAVRPDPAATPERAPAPAEAPSSGSGSAVPVGAGPEGVPGALSESPSGGAGVAPAVAPLKDRVDAKRKPTSESDQERSEREWRENFDRVASADDITKISTAAIERAINYADRVSQNEKRKGWDGSPTNKALIEAMDREVENLQFALKLRKPAAPVPDAAAPADQTAPPQAKAPEAAAPAKPAGFDAEAFDRERNERIKASRESGNTHLDAVPAYVETMRGKRIRYVHDPKVKGTIFTVDNSSNVYVDWSDAYSQEKEGASPVRYGKKTVMQSTLGPRDLKDYVLDKPANTAPLAERVEAKKKVAEPTIFALLAGKRSFTLGELTKDGEPFRVKLNNKQTSRADWYFEIYADGKVADSIPFPALSNGPMTASKAADLLLDYLRTDSDAKWEIRLDGEAAPSVSPAPAASPASETAPPKAKRPPKSFRKKVVVTTDVFVEESGRFEQRETDADSALKALDEDVAELERLRKCLGG